MQSTEILFVLRLSLLLYFSDITEQISEKYSNGVALFSHSQRAKKHVYQQFVSSTVATKFRKLCQTWILCRAFYGARKVTNVSTLAKVNETIEHAKNVVNVVVLPPEAEDFRSQESNVENVANSLEEIFEPAGKLKVEEEFENNEKSETALPSTRKKRFTNLKKIITSIKQF